MHGVCLGVIWFYVKNKEIMKYFFWLFVLDLKNVYIFAAII